MNNSIASRLGENFTFSKKIIENNIEILKLDIAESLSAVLGQLISYIIIVSIGLLSMIGVLIASTILLADLMNSTVGGIFMMAGILGAMTLLLYFKRQDFLNHYISRKFCTKLPEDEWSIKNNSFQKTRSQLTAEMKLAENKLIRNVSQFNMLEEVLPEMNDFAFTSENKTHAVFNMANMYINTFLPKNHWANSALEFLTLMLKPKVTPLR